MSPQRIDQKDNIYSIINNDYELSINYENIRQHKQSDGIYYLMPPNIF